MTDTTPEAVAGMVERLMEPADWAIERPLVELREESAAMLTALSAEVERLRVGGLEITPTLQLARLNDEITTITAERDQARADLAEAVGRIRDMLDGDDGQAYSEARSFLTKYKETHQQ